MDINEKLDYLEKYLKDLGSVAVAFSGGVDSSFLLKTAHNVLGGNAVAITAVSCLFPEREYNEAKEFCLKEGIKHITVKSDVFDIEGFANNPVNRCYLCKKEIFGKIIKIAKENNIAYIAEGSNVDDEGDYRPGMKAISELGVKSPLRSCGLNKAEIRILSKQMGLDVWDKQSYACLASRFVYGEEINTEKLSMVDKAEQLLLDIGLKQVRVRVHGNIARIEAQPKDFAKLISDENRLKITEKFSEYGFAYTSMDLKGYRTGSMNETLKEK